MSFKYGLKLSRHGVKDGKTDGAMVRAKVVTVMR